MRAPLRCRSDVSLDQIIDQPEQGSSENEHLTKIGTNETDPVSSTLPRASINIWPLLRTSVDMPRPITTEHNPSTNANTLIRLPSGCLREPYTAYGCSLNCAPQSQQYLKVSTFVRRFRSAQEPPLAQPNWALQAKSFNAAHAGICCNHSASEPPR